MDTTDSDAKTPPVPEVDPTATANPTAVLNYIDKKMAADLAEMGFEPVMVEKALYLTDNASLEAAIEWIGSKQETQDGRVPLSEAFVDRKEAKRPRALSPEESKQMALELQKKLAAQRAAREKDEAKEREKRRIQQTKELQMAQQSLDEEEVKRAAAMREREKQQHEAERDRQLELMKKEWEARHVPNRREE
eukprot:Filipodium_phascolosomae@DN6039_c0_g1_i1.p1